MKSKTLLLPPTNETITQVCKIWHSSGLVAFPTETVYGLGANACHDMAVAKIFAAKKRPHFNPLIVHVAHLDMAQQFAVFNKLSLSLAQAFWPGPMTLVLPIKQDAGLSSLVTAGLNQIAIRIPKHSLSQKLLMAFGGAIAAPSANPSGAISPTMVHHVITGLEGEIDAVIDGGKCPIGVESTILRPLDNAIEILRDGGLTRDTITSHTGITPHSPAPSITPNAPGQLASHYAPDTQLRMNVITPKDNEYHIGFGTIAGHINLSTKGDIVEAAANLFNYLHLADEDAKTLGISQIAIAPIPTKGIGLAMNDRLKRASAPRP